MSVDDLGEWLESVRVSVDSRLEKIGRDATLPDPLRPALEQALHSKGKRIRAALIVAVYDALGGGRKSEPAIVAGAAIEMIHASSLILDDLPAMDDADLRRGEPALHLAVGEDLAILAAVALLNHAYSEVATAWQLAKPRRHPLCETIDVVVNAVGWDGTIGGESVDLHSEGSELDFRTLEYIHSRKTGALFVASAVLGAMLANASESAKNAVANYAKNLGLAFQIVDDILDVTADASEIGKNVGKDAARLTFVKLAGVEGSRELVDELVETSIASLSNLGRRTGRLEDLARWVRHRAG